MKTETNKRFWRIVYSNSQEKPFTDCSYEKVLPLSVQEKNCKWDAVRFLGRFYWVTDFYSPSQPNSTQLQENIEKILTEK